jgi:hypothetical protein
MMMIMKRSTESNLKLVNQMEKNRINKIVGLTTGCVHILLLCRTVYWYYMYNFSNVLFYIMYPNEVLLLRCILCAFGILISTLFYKNKLGSIFFWTAIIIIWSLLFYSYEYVFW